MIEVSGLTKEYGSTRAVDDLTFMVSPGMVTGFVGPNGSGKTTTMRLIMGLDRPTSGTATIDGKRYRDLERPSQSVGALLDAKAIHPHRSAVQHLRWLAAAGGVQKSRVDEVLGIVGLSAVASKKVGGFSLGMHQRLGIAAALLGDPETLILDEPMNGLDPEGIRWVRDLLAGLAARGRTILVSSHLLSEVSQIAGQVVVIGRGRLVAQASTEDFIRSRSGSRTIVRTVAIDLLVEALRKAGFSPERGRDKAGRETIELTDASTDEVGKVAYDAAIPLAELSVHTASLEDAFMQVSDEHAEYVPEKEQDR